MNVMLFTKHEVQKVIIVHFDVEYWYLYKLDIGVYLR